MKCILKYLMLTMWLQSCDSGVHLKVASPDSECHTLDFHTNSGVVFSENETVDNAIYDTTNIYYYKYTLTDVSGFSGAIMIDGFNVNDSIYEPEGSNEKILDNFSITGKDVLNRQDVVGWEQTPMYIEYYNREGDMLMTSQTGLVDNCKNVWMHPVRQARFMQNYTSPWPYVKYGKNEWNWSFTYNGTGWQNIILEDWTDTMTINYEYKITGLERLQVGNERLDCSAIDAKGLCRLGSNSSRFLFSPKYGFVKMQSINLDGSRSVIYLYKVVQSQ